MAREGKGNKREQLVADKEAATIVKSLSRASDAAVHTTLAGINVILKENIPLMYHINALLNDPEWTAVLESSLKTQEQPIANGDKLDHRKLRSIVKKFQHLDRLSHMLAFTCMCIFELLHHLKHVYVLLHVPIHVLRCNIKMNYAFIFVFCFFARPCMFQMPHNRMFICRLQNSGGHVGAPHNVNEANRSNSYQQQQTLRPD